MKYGCPDVHLRTIVVAALMSSSVLASARAAQVEVSDPFQRSVLETKETIDTTFLVNNTGLPNKVAVDIGQMTVSVSAVSGDTTKDVLSDGSIIETNCGTLGVRQTCKVVVRYDILDGDPFDKDKTLDFGKWRTDLVVSWATSTAMGSTSGGNFVSVGDLPLGGAPIPEPSTWVGLLVGFSALGFAGCRRARCRQALASVRS